MSDHVHMLISITPKYAVSQLIGYVKGKSAIRVSCMYGERKRNFVAQHFWARGVLRDDGGTRRDVDPRVHPNARGSGSAARLAEYVETLSGPPERWSLISRRVSLPVQPLQRLTSKSPRLCRGIFTPH